MNKRDKQALCSAAQVSALDCGTAAALAQLEDIQNLLTELIRTKPMPLEVKEPLTAILGLHLITYAALLRSRNIATFADFQESETQQKEVRH